MIMDKASLALGFGVGFIVGSIAMYAYYLHVEQTVKEELANGENRHEMGVEHPSEMPLEGHRIASEAPFEWIMSESAENAISTEKAMSAVDAMKAEINDIKNVVGGAILTNNVRTMIDYSRPQVVRGEASKEPEEEDQTLGYSFITESEASDLVRGGELSESIDIVYFTEDETWTEQNDLFDTLTPESVADCIGEGNYESIVRYAELAKNSGKYDYYLYNAGDLSLVSITITEGAWADICAYGPVWAREHR